MGCNCGGRAVLFAQSVGFARDEVEHTMYLEVEEEDKEINIPISTLKENHFRLSIYVALTSLFPRWAARHPWRGVQVNPLVPF